MPGLGIVWDRPNEFLKAVVVLHVLHSPVKLTAQNSNIPDF